MNYKLKPTNEVFETNTEQVIKSFKTKDEAKKFLRFLNLGGAFDGWTPSFVLIRPKTK